MRIHLLLGTLLLAAPAAGQTPPAAAAPKPAPPAATAPPAAPQQAPAKPAAVPGAPAAAPAAPRATAAAAANAKTAIVIEATDTRGLGLKDIRVELAGPVPRDGTTDAAGTIRFLGLRPGTYRARFSGESVVTFEKEITVAAGRTAETEATLTAAEPKPEPPPPPPPPPPAPVPAPEPVVGPAGQPQLASLIDILERERPARGQNRLETLVACSGNTRSTLVQLTQDQPQRLYDGAEVVLYVIAGEASVTAGGREGLVQPGGFISVPRQTPYVIKRRGSKPLMLLSVLAGEPCEAAR